MTRPARLTVLTAAEHDRLRDLVASGRDRRLRVEPVGSRFYLLDVPENAWCADHLDGYHLPDPEGTPE